MGPWQELPASEEAEARIKLGVALACSALIALDLRAGRGALEGRASWYAWAAAVLAVAAYPNFGRLHGDRLHHDWEQFHYTLSAKYSSELGYDGLYAASIQAQLEHPVVGRVPHFTLRDLRTNQVVGIQDEASRRHRAEVRARFSDARWQQFVRDHEHFVRHVTSAHLANMRRDHGFNAPPSWTFVARLFAGRVRADDAGLDGLGTIDLVLVALGLGALGWAFGSRVLCCAVVLFGVSYVGRYFWVGGSLLRFDWLAALMISAALLHRRRAGLAGAALGYAAAVRLFPLFFAAGPLVLALKALWGVRRTPWRTRVADPAVQGGLRFVCGVALALGLAVLAGAAVGDGLGAWSTYAEVIELHRGTWLTNNVGLQNLVLHDADTFGRRLVDFSQAEPWTAWQERLEENLRQRGAVLLAVQGLFLAALGVTAAFLSPAASLALGVVPVFVIFLSTCYYWQMLALTPVLGSARLVLALLGANLGMWALHLRVEGFEVRYGTYSWMLALVFGAWLVARLLRARPEVRGGSRTADPHPE